jgi:hypothetical protein
VLTTEVRPSPRAQTLPGECRVPIAIPGCSAHRCSCRRPRRELARKAALRR